MSTRSSAAAAAALAAPAADAPAPKSSFPPVPAGYTRLVHHYAFYGAYHINPVNQWIHIVCVPIILATALLMAHALSPAPAALLPGSVLGPDATARVLEGVVRLSGGQLSIATYAAAIYMAFYVVITPTLLGVATSTLTYALFRAALAAIPALGTNAVPIAAGIHIACWLAQFYGHGVYEKRAPALLDNLFQAIFMAPIFVFMEVLSKFGVLANVHAAADRAVAAKIHAMRVAADAKKAA